MVKLTITPPLLNTACPWATTKDDLETLYALSSTGAVSVRTSLIDGFTHDENIHQYAFLQAPQAGGSVNSIGYSPIKLDEYLQIVKEIVDDAGEPQTKPFIVSVTGSAAEVKSCVSKITSFSKEKLLDMWAEINLSCPNIPNEPPPAYDQAALESYLQELGTLEKTVPVGVKVPPYTHDGQFNALVSALESYPKVVRFITSTNTIGSSLALTEIPPSPASVKAGLSTYNWSPTLPSNSMLGGLAGAPLHPLALGNVLSISRRLAISKSEELNDILVIGVGGVSDPASYSRMLYAGAGAVGVATALGVTGPSVFSAILGQTKEGAYHNPGTWKEMEMDGLMGGGSDYIGEPVCENC